MCLPGCRPWLGESTTGPMGNTGSANGYTYLEGMGCGVCPSLHRTFVLVEVQFVQTGLRDVTRVWEVHCSMRYIIKQELVLANVEAVAY